MRLEKLLIDAGLGSRNQIKKLIKSRQVTIDGYYASKGNQNVDPGLQSIQVAGKGLSLFSEPYFIMNKPAGAVTAGTDKEHKTVLDYLAPEDRVEGIYPVGRLDRDTEGFLLLTTNGPLGFRLLHPKYHIDKTYYVEVNAELKADAPAFFQSGITFLDGTVCKPAKLEVLSSSLNHSKAYITITEGKFHQVKKMFLTYGVKVIYLKRISFGQLKLDDDLGLGSYRCLNQEEKEIIKTYLD